MVFLIILFQITLIRFLVFNPNSKLNDKIKEDVIIGILKLSHISLTSFRLLLATIPLLLIANAIADD